MSKRIARKLAALLAFVVLFTTFTSDYNSIGARASEATGIETLDAAADTSEEVTNDETQKTPAETEESAEAVENTEESQPAENVSVSEETAEQSAEEDVPAEETAEQSAEEDVPAEETAEQPEEEATPTQETAQQSAEEETPAKETAQQPEEETAPAQETAQQSEEEAAPAEETAEVPAEETTSAEENVEQPAEESQPVADTEKASEETEEVAEITINYVASIGGSVSIDSETVTDKAAGAKATADVGYEFVNWTDDADVIVSDKVEFTPDGDQLVDGATFTANFQKTEKEFNQSVEIDGINIALYAKKGVLPADAELKVEKVTGALDQKIEDKIDAATKEEVVETFSYDINIYSPSEDKNVQPEDGTVEVRFESIEAAAEDDTTLSVYHYDEKKETVEEVASSDDTSADEIGFEAEHFSIYTVTVFGSSYGPFVFEAQTVNMSGEEIGYNSIRNVRLDSSWLDKEIVPEKVAPIVSGYHFVKATYEGVEVTNFFRKIWALPGRHFRMNLANGKEVIVYDDTRILFYYSEETFDEYKTSNHIDLGFTNTEFNGVSKAIVHINDSSYEMNDQPVSEEELNRVEKRLNLKNRNIEVSTKDTIYFEVLFNGQWYSNKSRASEAANKRAYEECCNAHTYRQDEFGFDFKYDFYQEFNLKADVNYYNNNPDGTVESPYPTTANWTSEDQNSKGKVTIAQYSATGFTAPENYEFTGWNTKADGSGDAYTLGENGKFNPESEEISAGTTLDLYAQWERTSHTVSYIGVYPDENKTKMEAQVKTVGKDEEVTVPHAADFTLSTADAAIYKVDGFYGDENLTQAYATETGKITADKTVYVKLSYKTAKITVIDRAVDETGKTIFEKVREGLNEKEVNINAEYEYSKQGKDSDYLYGYEYKNYTIKVGIENEKTVVENTAKGAVTADTKIVFIYQRKANEDLAFFLLIKDDKKPDWTGQPSQDYYPVSSKKDWPGTAKNLDTLEGVQVKDPKDPYSYKALYNWDGLDQATVGWKYNDGTEGKINSYLNTNINNKITNNAEKFSANDIVWYVYKRQSDGCHIDGYLKANLVYDANGGATKDGLTTITETGRYNGVVTVKTGSQGFERTGYEFLGWSTNKNATAAETFTDGVKLVKKSTTLYAVWKANQYTVTYKNDDNKTIESKKQNYGDKTFTPEKTPTTSKKDSELYDFIGWKKVPGNGESADNKIYTNAEISEIPVSKDVTYKAVYKHARYKAYYNVEFYYQSKDGKWPNVATNKLYKEAKEEIITIGETKKIDVDPTYIDADKTYTLNDSEFKLYSEGTLNKWSGELSQSNKNLTLKVQYKRLLTGITITISSPSAEKIYDGEALTKGVSADEYSKYMHVDAIDADGNEIDLSERFVLEKLELSGKNNGGVGTAKNTISKYTIRDTKTGHKYIYGEKGKTSQTEYYVRKGESDKVENSPFEVNMITTNPGDLTITARHISVVLPDVTKTYDGKKATLPEGYAATVEAVYSEEEKAAGKALDLKITTGKNGFSVAKVTTVAEGNESDEDIKLSNNNGKKGWNLFFNGKKVDRNKAGQFKNFVLDGIENGDIIINPALVTLKSKDLTKKFDNTYLTNGDEPLEVEEGFVEGEGAVYTFTGKQLTPNKPEDVNNNTFEYVAKNGTDFDNYSFVDENGNSTVTFGTLTVTPLDENEKIKIVVMLNTTNDENGSDTYKYYNGQKQYADLGVNVDVDVKTFKKADDNDELLGGMSFGGLFGAIKAHAEEDPEFEAVQDKVVDITEDLSITVTGLYVTGGAGIDVDTYPIYLHKGGMQVLLKDNGVDMGDVSDMYQLEVKYVDSKSVKSDDEAPEKTGLAAAIAALFGSADEGEKADAADDTASTDAEPEVQPEIQPEDVTAVIGNLYIMKRNVNLTSASAEKVYDGTALTEATVTATAFDESGNGFVEGEGATYDVTGSQTEVGESDNTFTYTLNENTKDINYEVATEFGKLKVTEAPATDKKEDDKKQDETPTTDPEKKTDETPSTTPDKKSDETTVTDETTHENEKVDVDDNDDDDDKKDKKDKKDDKNSDDNKKSDNNNNETPSNDDSVKNDTQTGAVLGASRTPEKAEEQPGVLGARRGGTEDTTNSARIIVLLIAAGAVATLLATGKRRKENEE